MFHRKELPSLSNVQITQLPFGISKNKAVVRIRYLRVMTAAFSLTTFSSDVLSILFEYSGEHSIAFAAGIRFFSAPLMELLSMSVNENSNREVHDRAQINEEQP